MLSAASRRQGKRMQIRGIACCCEKRSIIVLRCIDFGHGMSTSLRIHNLLDVRRGARSAYPLLTLMLCLFWQVLILRAPLHEGEVPWRHQCAPASLPAGAGYNRGLLMWGERVDSNAQGVVHQTRLCTFQFFSVVHACQLLERRL